MTDWLKRWAIAHSWRLRGYVGRNRSSLYNDETGLRILAFHQTGPRVLPQLMQVVEWCSDRFQIASPAEADALFAGTYVKTSSDRILVTFDDGFESNFAAAEWLARKGVKATFFIVPSLIDRSLAEYAEFHRRNGVEACIMGRGEGGLSAGQVAEMASMGHRIAAHNFAHRDLGRLHDPPNLRYEVLNSLEAVAELTGRPCVDFAFAFGQPANVSSEAARYLSDHCRGVYCCFRGLNVPGQTPRFALRHDCRLKHPMAFTRLCIEGGADHHLAGRASSMSKRVGLLPAIAAGNSQ